jgi:S-adenosylmethionine synthetase
MSEPSLTLAEFVLPGHPDKVCDRIADLLVDAACARDPRALVGVEVACHRGVVYVTGCVATDPPLTRADVDALARRGFREAGYGAAWGPDPETLKVEADVRLERLDDDLRRLRDISDDQAITIGWAGGRREDNYLPRAHRLSWLACQALRALREEAGLGPDGKVLVVERGGEVERMSLSLQHRTGPPASPSTGSPRGWRRRWGSGTSIG